MANLEKVPCPICDEQHKFLPLRVPRPREESIRTYEKLFDGAQISQWKACGNCGFAHLNPRPSAESLDRFYLNAEFHASTGDKTNREKDEYIQFANWYFGDKVEYAIQQCPKGQSVFEIGYGLGGSLQYFREKGWKTYGIEPDATHFEFAKNKLGLTGIQTGLLDESIEVEEKVDLIYSNHVFEHFTDLHGLMRAVRKILKPGGKIVTVVPTYMSNRTDMSLRSMNYAHTSCFTHNSFNQLFAHHGMEYVTHTYRGWIKEVDDIWHVAEFTDNTIDPKQYFENPREVQRYINVINPIRSAVLWLFFSNYADRVILAGRVKMLFTNPALFWKKVINVFNRKLGRSPA